MTAKNSFLLITILFLSSCGNSPVRTINGNKKSTSLNPVDASGFSVEVDGNILKMTVKNPWQKSVEVNFDYFLVDSGAKIPAGYLNKQVLVRPLKKVVCLSTTHIGFLDALGEIPAITGISGLDYLSNATAKKRVESHQIVEVGYERSLNYEVLLQLKPDVVFAFGVGSEVSGQINKLQDLGIPVVLVGEYLESTPLAKAEWIKFFGAFFNKEVLAGQVYDSIKSNYESIRQKVMNVSTKPLVLTGLPFKDTWWIAGGQSNLAHLINDAGGTFLWKDNASKEAFPVALEEVFLRSYKADYWINCGSAGSMAELLSSDQRFTELPAVKKDRIFNNNLRSTSNGGNDYWESGVMHPDLVLSDLMRIFHPEIANKQDFTYYRKLE